MMVSLLSLITSTSPCCDYDSGALLVILYACIEPHWLHVWCVDGDTGRQLSALLTCSCCVQHMLMGLCRAVALRHVVLVVSGAAHAAL